MGSHLPGLVSVFRKMDIERGSGGSGGPNFLVLHGGFRLVKSAEAIGVFRTSTKHCKQVNNVMPSFVHNLTMENC